LLHREMCAHWTALLACILAHAVPVLAVPPEEAHQIVRWPASDDREHGDEKTSVHTPIVMMHGMGDFANNPLGTAGSTESTGSAVAAAATTVKEPTAVFLAARGNPSGNLHGDIVIPMFPKTGLWTDLASIPRWVNDYCSTVWTGSIGKYRLPYRVGFGTTSFFHWLAPLANGASEECGSSTHLSSVHIVLHHNGSWEASYFAARRFATDATNSTNCCCEYVGQAAGAGQPLVLAAYCGAAVPNSSQLPFEEVCAPRNRQCPLKNATALAEMGPPFLTIYSPCASVAEYPFTGRSPEALLQCCLALLLVLVAAVQLARVACKAKCIAPSQKCDMNKALLY